MKRLEIPVKKDNKDQIFQTRVDYETAEKAKTIADQYGFRISDVLRSGLDVFISQYGSKKLSKEK